MSHVVDRIEDVLGGETRVVMLWLGLSLTPFVMAESQTLGLWGALVVFGIGAAAFSHRQTHISRRETEIEDLAMRFIDGDLDDQQFEQGIELILDDVGQLIRDRVAEVDGIGPASSANLALRFRSIDDMASTSVEALAEVPGVGDRDADRIVETLREQDDEAEQDEEIEEGQIVETLVDQVRPADDGDEQDEEIGEAVEGIFDGAAMADDETEQGSASGGPA